MPPNINDLIVFLLESVQQFLQPKDFLILFLL